MGLALALCLALYSTIPCTCTGRSSDGQSSCFAGIPSGSICTGGLQRRWLLVAAATGSGKRSASGLLLGLLLLLELQLLEEGLLPQGCHVDDGVGHAHSGAHAHAAVHVYAHVHVDAAAAADPEEGGEGGLLLCLLLLLLLLLLLGLELADQGRRRRGWDTDGGIVGSVGSIDIDIGIGSLLLLLLLQLLELLDGQLGLGLLLGRGLLLVLLLLAAAGSADDGRIVVGVAVAIGRLHAPCFACSCKSISGRGAGVAIKNAKSVSREIERRVGTKTATFWARNRLNLRSTGIEHMYNAKYMYCSS